MPGVNSSICFANRSKCLIKRDHNKTNFLKLQLDLQMDASPFVTASIKEPVEFLMTSCRGQSPSPCISVTDGTGHLMQAKAHHS